MGRDAHQGEGTSYRLTLFLVQPLGFGDRWSIGVVHGQPEVKFQLSYCQGSDPGHGEPPICVLVSTSLMWGP